MALSYNTINFCYPRTDVHIMGPAKDPSGTDQLYTQVRLKVQSYIYAVDDGTRLVTFFDPTSAADVIGFGGGPTVPGAAAVNTMTRIRHMLTAPRKQLYWDGTSLPGTTSPPTGGAAYLDIPERVGNQGGDDANGPWPDDSAFEIKYVTPGCYEVTWACTVCIRDCPTDPVPVKPISLRWSDDLSWDRYWKLTYRRSGLLIVSSNDVSDIDYYRRAGVIRPAVYAGFRRNKAKYTMDPSGLKCTFEFEDEQIRFAPPYPAVEMTIHQSEDVPLPGGQRKGSVVVRLVGVQSANVRDLMAWSLTIAGKRAYAACPLAGAGGVLLGNMNFTSTETDTAVEVSASMSYKVQPEPLSDTLVMAVVNDPKIDAAVRAKLFAARLVGGRAAQAAIVRELIRARGGVPDFFWCGFGTSDPSVAVPYGWAGGWADPLNKIQTPDRGTFTATPVSMLAAVLQDPCGTSLPAGR